jgi:hypothetical protein
MSERVFHDFNTARTVNKRDVKTRVGVQSHRHAGKVFASGIENPLHLASADAFRSAGEITGAFHFDKYQTIILLDDKIDFAAPATPTALTGFLTTTIILSGDLIFGNHARMKRGSTTHLDFPKASAA